MDTPVTWAEEAQVVLVAAQLGVLIVAALVAWRQVREARRLREQQNRPFVVMDFDVERGVETYLEVVNLGTSLARDVKFKINPPLASAVDVPVNKFKMLNQGIPTLAPGKRFRTFFDIGFQRVGSDLPMSYSVSVEYKDEDRKRVFNEDLDLDLEQFMYLESPTRRDLHDVNERLEEIRDTLRRWGWSSGGLLTVSRAEADEKNRQRREEIEEQRRQRKPTDGEDG
ncbi:MAG: hypothetical protein ACTHK3_02190 [Solirubrobacterales bacterium]